MTEEEYFVTLFCERWLLRRIKASETLRLPPGKEERLKHLELEVTERERRLGGSVRRKVNALLSKYGYPDITRR